MTLQGPLANLQRDCLHAHTECIVHSMPGPYTSVASPISIAIGSSASKKEVPGSGGPALDGEIYAVCNYTLGPLLGTTDLDIIQENRK